MKGLIIGAVIFLSLCIIPSLVHAIDYCPGGQFDPLCKMRGDDFTVLPRNILNIMLVGAVLLSLGFLIYGGIKWITSGGDKSKVDGARGTVTAAIIGLIISFLAFTIVSLVSYFFGLKEGTIYELPTLNSDPRASTPATNGTGNTTPGCFLAGTKILLANGSYKNIEDVQIGDKLQSYDVKHGVPVTDTVSKTFIHKNTTTSYLVINDVLRVTANHPIWIVNKHTWLAAEKIEEGDVLLDKAGKHIPVSSIREVNDTQIVYNLQMNGDNHNYYADSILVHNKPGE